MRNFKIDDISFVVIGRNEALNLDRCFESIKRVSSNIIFVDSNSDDDSLAIAKKHEVNKIVKLTSNHYSASLGRSVGAELAVTDLIQFIDGDMELNSDWPLASLEFLNSNDQVAVKRSIR